MFEEISSVFFDEANELLDNLEGYLLTLETEPDNKEIIGAVFRAMHTIKGSSGMFGFDAIQKFTHEMESTFDMVRNGEVPVTKELISLTLEARDHIRSMLQNQNGAEQAEESDKIISALHSYTAQYKTPAAQPVHESTSTKAAAEKTTQNETQQSNTWRIIFRPSPDILKNGTRPELLVKELCEMGMATVVPFSNQIPPLSELDPEKCYLSWDVILTTTKK